MHGWAGKLSEVLEGAERLDDIFRYLGFGYCRRRLLCQVSVLSRRTVRDFVVD